MIKEAEYFMNALEKAETIEQVLALHDEYKENLGFAIERSEILAQEINRLEQELIKLTKDYKLDMMSSHGIDIVIKKKIGEIALKKHLEQIPNGTPVAQLFQKRNDRLI